MSISENITNAAEGSDNEVKDRANAELNNENIRQHKLANDIAEQDKEERKTYANLSFTLVSMWLTMVLVIFIAIGQKRLEYSDTVIVTLLTTTTINVIGIYIIVANYLFPSKK
jgi:hypothetical protein